MLCSSQQGYSDMTSSTSSKSNIWCNLCASVKGAGLAAADAELPCLLLLPRVLGFSMCVLSAAAALCFALARRSVGVAEGDSGEAVVVVGAGMTTSGPWSGHPSGSSGAAGRATACGRTRPCDAAYLAPSCHPAASLSASESRSRCSGDSSVLRRPGCGTAGASCRDRRCRPSPPPAWSRDRSATAAPHGQSWRRWTGSSTWCCSAWAPSHPPLRRPHP